MLAHSHDMQDMILARSRWCPVVTPAVEVGCGQRKERPDGGLGSENLPTTTEWSHFPRESNLWQVSALSKGV